MGYGAAGWRVRLRNIGWLVCALERVSQRSCRLPPILSSVASPPPTRPLSSRSLVPPSPRPLTRSGLVGSRLPYESLFRSGSPLSHPRAVPPSSCFLFSLATPRTLFLVFPDTYTPRDTECRVHHVYTCTRGLSRTYGSQGFCSWRPILSDNEDDPFSSRMEKGAGRTQDGEGDTILPSCRGRDIFSLSRITSKLE